jgi:hypothetical protein
MGGLCMIVSMRVVGCTSNVLEKTMSGMDLDGFIDKWVPWSLTKVKGQSSLIIMNS